jgi:hypothetical protein
MAVTSFKLPKNTYDRVRGMIQQLYGNGIVARAQDAWRKLF